MGSHFVPELWSSHFAVGIAVVGVYEHAHFPITCVDAEVTEEPAHLPTLYLRHCKEPPIRHIYAGEQQSWAECGKSLEPLAPHFIAVLNVKQ